MKNKFSFQAVVKQYGQFKQGTSQNGKAWAILPVLFEEVGEQYPQSFLVDFHNEKSQISIPVGTMCTVHFEINAREYNGKIYTSLKGWKVEVGQMAAPAPQPTQQWGAPAPQPAQAWQQPQAQRPAPQPMAQPAWGVPAPAPQPAQAWQQPAPQPYQQPTAPAFDPNVWPTAPEPQGDGGLPF